METITVISYLTIPAIVLAGFAIAANDVAIGMGGLLATGVIDMKAGLMLAAVLAVVGVFVLAEPPSSLWTDHLFDRAPDWQREEKAVALFSALLAVGLTMLALSAIGWIGSGILILGGAFLGLSVFGAADGLWLSVIVAWLLGMLLLPVTAGLFAIGINRMVRRYVVEVWRPRDRLTLFLPLALGLMALVGALLPPALFLLRLPKGFSSILVLFAIALGVGFGTALLAWLFIRRHPFWVNNDEAGAELAFYKPQRVAGAIASLGFGAYQALAVAAPARAILTLSCEPNCAAGGDGDVILKVFLPLAVGVLAGTLLLGHKSCERFAESTALTYTSGFAALFGTLAALVAAAGLGMSAIGRPAAGVAARLVSSESGLAGLAKSYGAMASAATLAILSAAILCITFYSMSRVLLNLPSSS